MNAVKIALLGTAALAAVSVSARADDLSDLKAQIEALNGRISQLESTPSIPAGYQLMSVSTTDAIIVPGLNSEKDKMYGKKAHNIGILPTADVPASTNIQWSGFVRVGLVYDSADKIKTVGKPGSAFVPTVTAVTGVDANADGDFLDAGDTFPVAAAAAIPAVPAVPATFVKNTFDVVSRAGIKVVGTTDTAVGEVGVRIALLASVETRGGVNRSHDSSVATDGYWGWWKITPELTLGGGVDGSLANSSNAFDNRCSCAYINTGGAFGHGDPTQIRLSYASGPISFAVAVEDEGNHDGTAKNGVGVAGEMKWSGDAIGFDINAGYFDGENGPAAKDADWTVNAGANLGLGDIAQLGLAVGVGETNHNSTKFSKASAFLGFTLSDALSAELGATYTNVKKGNDELTVAGGLYYTPVSQLTLGVEASYTDFKGPAKSNTVAAVISVWRF
jgi:hypothetical protein